MKKRINKPFRHGWIGAWMLQILEMLAVGALASLALGLHPAAYNLALWLVMPLLGAVSACQAVRRGLLNYAAWIAPPACMFLSHTLIWGYSAPAGAILLCAFIALIGAAAGEVLVRQKKQ